MFTQTKEVSKAKKVPKQEDGKNKGARGRYKCSLCGAFKVTIFLFCSTEFFPSHHGYVRNLQTNHVCALVADKLMCSVGTQITHGAAVLCQSTTDTLRCTSSTTDCGGSNDEGCSALGSVPTGELTPLGANSRAASIDLSGLILGPAPVPPSAIPSVDGGVVFQGATHCSTSLFCVRNCVISCGCFFGPCFIAVLQSACWLCLATGRASMTPPLPPS